MEYLKLYRDRMQQCSEIVDDAVRSGSDEEVKEAYALVGQMLMAAMQYAFDGVEPDFAPRSLEGAEWRGWRSDVDRADAKLANMKDLGSKGGKSKKSAQKAEATLEVREDDEATLHEPQATLEDVAQETSTNTNVNTYTHTNVKTNTNVKVNDNARAASAGSVTDHHQKFEPVRDISIEAALQKLCEEFPDVKKAGFKIELRKDLEERGYEKTRWLLIEADKANNKPTLQFNFYKAVKENRLNGGGAKSYGADGGIARTKSDRASYCRAAVVDVEAMPDEEMVS